MIKPGNIFAGLAIAVGVGFAWKYIGDLLNKFTFKVTGYGIPNFNNWVLKLPITVQFNNPTKATLSADDVVIDVFVKDGAGEFVQIGKVKQPFTLPPGKSSQTVVPVLNLSAVGGVLSSTLRNVIGTRTATIRTNLSVIFQGLKLPAQKYTDVIKV